MADPTDGYPRPLLDEDEAAVTSHFRWAIAEAEGDGMPEMAARYRLARDAYVRVLGRAIANHYVADLGRDATLVEAHFTEHAEELERDGLPEAAGGCRDTARRFGRIAGLARRREAALRN